MSDGDCQAMYTLRQWRREHDTEPQFEELFNANGEWHCPRDAIEDADRCPFHLRPEDQSEQDDEIVLSQRLVDELSGKTDIDPEQRGELVGVRIGDLVLSDVDITPNEEGPDVNGENGSEAPPIYLVGSTVRRLVVEEMELNRDLYLDGTEITRGVGPETDPFADGTQSSSEHMDDALTIRDADVNRVSLASTRVRGSVTFQGEKTSVDQVKVGGGSFTNGAISVIESATVDKLWVDGTETRVPRVVVAGGARVGVDASSNDSDKQPGLQLSEVKGPGAEIIVENAETEVSRVEVKHGDLEFLSVRDEATILESVGLERSTVSEVKLDDVHGRPSLSVRGEASSLNKVVVEEAALGFLSIENGATVSAVGLRGASTNVADVEITGPTTNVGIVRLSNDASVASGLRISGGGTVRDEILVRGSAVVRPPREADRDEAVFVSGADTRVGAVTVREEATVHGVGVFDGASTGAISVIDASVHGLAVDSATVDGGVRLEGARVGTLPGQWGDADDPSSGDESEPLPPVGSTAAIRVVDAMVTPEVTVAGGRVEGSVEVARATVRALAVESGASVEGPVDLREDATIKRSLALNGDLTHHAPLRLRDGATLSGNLHVATDDDESVAFETEQGVVIDNARVFGDILVEGHLAVKESALRVTDADVMGSVVGRGATVEGSIAVEAGSVVGRDIRLASARVDGRLTLSDGSLVEGTLHVDCASVDAVAVVDATVERRLTLVGDTTVHGPLRLQQDARVKGDVVVGSLPDLADTGAGLSSPDSGDLARVEDEDEDGTERTRVGKVVLGSVESSHPTSGGVSVTGNLAVTSNAAVLDGLSLNDVAVGEDIVISEAVVQRAVSLEDSTVDGRFRVVSVVDLAELKVVDSEVRSDLEVVDTDDLVCLTVGASTVSGTLAVEDSTVRDRDSEEDSTAVDLWESTVGEDVRLVGEEAETEAGDMELFDCIVNGKFRVDRASLDSVSLRECRVGESVWVGPTTEDESDRSDGDSGSKQETARIDEGRDRTTVARSLTIQSTPIVENVIVRRATAGRLALEDAIVNGRVTVSRIHVHEALVIDDTHIKDRVTVKQGLLGGLAMCQSAVDRRLLIGERADDSDTVGDSDDSGHPDSNTRRQRDGGGSSDPELIIDGPFDVETVSVGGDLTVDCRVSESEDGDEPWPALESVGVEGRVILQPELETRGRVSLRGSTIRDGEIVVTAPRAAPDEHIWYDLREATLGDVDLLFGEETTGDAVIDHILLLETHYDGFRFSALEGGLEGSDARLHTLNGTGAAELLNEIETPDERLDPDGGWLCEAGRAFGSTPVTGTGYGRDDPPPDVLERTYLNAKNGASQAGDEGIAGRFFIREKRYRRRMQWERLCGATNGDDSHCSPSARTEPMDGNFGPDRLASAVREGRTLGRWLANGLLDRVAVYGESPRRVVEVSGLIVIVFAVLFAVMLDQPPYGDKYHDTGLLPDAVAQLVQPLTLSVESFVTLVLVGPAKQRLTPLVHLLGQFEGFLGVFLIALFVFTLTRSIHR